jgi:putative flippase GtrA
MPIDITFVPKRLAQKIALCQGRVHRWVALGSQFRKLKLKAIMFSLIGVINTLVDYVVFLFARWALSGSTTAVAALTVFAGRCRCGSAEALLLVVSNVIAWTVAVSGSYVMNSLITFGVESGRRLRWRDYFKFVCSGLAAVTTNTVLLLIASQIFLLPAWLAKAAASMASVAINFSLLHFVVFDYRKRSGG